MAREAAGGRGTGLGLVVARQVARAAGGDLELVTSSADETRFRCRVPLA
jgi:signal transduction histidine kinase